MTLTRDIELTQGDTTRLVVPVFDADRQPQFFEDLTDQNVTATVEFAAAFDRDAVTFIEAEDVTTRIREFGDVNILNDRFGFENIRSVDSPDGFAIPDSQAVAVFELDSTETDQLPVTGGDDSDEQTGVGDEQTDVVYQVRLEDTGASPDRNLTPVRGGVTVRGRVPFDS